MERIISVALFVVMVLPLNACSSSKDARTTAVDTAATTAVGTTTTSETEAMTETARTVGTAEEDLKVGLIHIDDENEGYTAIHHAGATDMKNALDLNGNQLIFKWLVPEGETCYDAIVDLADQSCNIIFGNSFGLRSYMIQAAEESSDVQFYHAIGYQAKMNRLSNMRDYFTSIHGSCHVSDAIAGMKLNEMIADDTITEDTAKTDYVDTSPYAEVIGDYTSFFLSVRSICPSAVMDVTYTNSWASFDLGRETAEALITDKCVLISQCTDTTGTATVCEATGVPIVGYNISMIVTAPSWALISTSVNWGLYVTYAVGSVMNGETIVVDWCHSYTEGADKITELNEKTTAEGTAERIKKVEDAIIAGTLHVSDTSTQTVSGKTYDSYERDGNEYISDRYFHESELTSIPAFDVKIDGINDLTN